MNKLYQNIKSIPKSYFYFADVRKISGQDDSVLRVSLNRLVKQKLIFRLTKGVYTLDAAQVDWEMLAQELYTPSYLSFEWILAKYGLLSQQPYHLTLACAKRSRVIKASDRNIFYHHLQPKVFWGFQNKNGILEATPEKALADLAYLSLNGYAKFDVEEINWDEIDKSQLKLILKKMGIKKLNKIINLT